MKYFNLRTLVIFLALNTITLILTNVWTPDKGWMPFMASLFIGFSIFFWLILSVISLIRKAKLKKELFYFIGLGLWSIIITIEYFKLGILNGNISDKVHLGPYIAIVILWILPIKRLWKVV